MNRIGGNTVCDLIYDSGYTNNEIGEKVPVRAVYKSLTGFLDLSNGDSRFMTYNTKLQESTHIFICDYTKIEKNASELRAVINGKEYEITTIDNPMELNKHLEIYLNYVGE